LVNPRTATANGGIEIIARKGTLPGGGDDGVDEPSKDCFVAVIDIETFWTAQAASKKRVLWTLAKSS
jgi:hypothetical protein